MQNIDLMGLLAGLGVFLFGLSQVEVSLRQWVSHSFRQWLADATRTPLRGALTGVLTTGLLQSSTLVTLLAQAFVAAGVLPLANALGVIFGANLGTTVTGWIVAGIGLKFDASALALPLLALGLLSATLLPRSSPLRRMGSAIAGFGFLFYGLALMHGAVHAFAQQTDIGFFRGGSLLGYAAYAFVFTAIIHSSAATMVLTLSALSAGLLDIQSAAAIVIGADLGTTITAVMAGLSGSNARKQVAAAHVGFNLVSDAIAFAAMGPLLQLAEYIGGGDPARQLVAFHSTFNLIGVLLFLPLSHKLAALLERYFNRPATRVCANLSPAVAESPVLIRDALAQEVRGLLRTVADFNSRLLKPSDGEAWLATPPSHTDAYAHLKAVESEIAEFALQTMQGGDRTSAEVRAIDYLVRAVRHAIRSAKAIKDVQQNLDEIHAVTHSAVRELRERWFADFHGIQQQLLLSLEQHVVATEQYEESREAIQSTYRQEADQIYQLAASTGVTVSVSTLLNVNYECMRARRDFLEAVHLYLQGLPTPGETAENR